MTHGGIEKVVHIIPLGYEVDRAIRPIEHEKVDRVHLVTMDETVKYSSPNEKALTKKQRHYDQLVKTYLTNLGVEVVIHRVDMFETLPVMNLISTIILEEKQKGSSIWVNMSSCGRFTSFAVIISAMAHQVKLYYVKADSYSRTSDETDKHGLSICNSCRIRYLENIKFDLPSGLDREILLKISNASEGVSGEDLIRDLICSGIKGYDVRYWELPIRERRKCQSNYLTKLRKGPIERLIQSGYIFKTKIGRQFYLHLSPSGKYISCICKE